MTGTTAGMATAVPAVLAGLAAAVAFGVPRAASRRLVDVAATTPWVRVPAPGLRAAPVVGAAVLVAWAAGASPLLAAAAAPALALAGVASGRRLVAARQRRAHSAEERRRAAEACAAVASELRAGRSPLDALSAAADVAGPRVAAALAAAAGSARLGGDAAAALEAAAGRAPDPVSTALRSLAACWRLCAGTGAGLATAVERLGEALREVEEQHRAVAAELAGPRATALLLAVLPVGGLALATALGGAPWRFLVGHPVGLVCLVAGAALDAAGVAWTRRLVTRASAA